MGICKKCKKKTDLYCFKHKQTICAACLSAADNEHACCYVGSYSDFLHLSAEEVDALVQYTCPTCSEGINESQQFFRLPCLHLIHQDCLQKIVSELPADTARGGFVCPKCNKPVFSSGDVSGDSLASALVARLHDLAWAAPLLATLSSGTQAPSESSSSSPESSTGDSTPKPETTPAKPEGKSDVAEDVKPDPTKPSASSLFVQQSNNKGTLPPPPSSQQQHHKPQARSTVASGVPGVALFVPPPPPKPQPIETIPVVGSAFSNLPLSDAIDGDEASGEEFLNIQIPPLGSRLAARKAIPLGDYGGNAYYGDDDNEKNHHSALVQVVNYFGLAKRVNGRMVIDKSKVVLVLAVIVFILFIFIHVFLPIFSEKPGIEHVQE